MDEFIQNLAHDNDLFEEQWPNTFTHIAESVVPNDSKLVSNALADYVLIEPMDPLACEVKYVFTRNEVSIDVNDLVNTCIRILDSSRTDRWNLHFLETIYRNFEIGEQLFSTQYLVEQILQSLQKKILEFNSEENHDKWQTFLTASIFSNSSNDKNILNKQDIITNMQTILYVK
jgi:hypothetical protein